jgi:hypothetical protein
MNGNIAFNVHRRESLTVQFHDGRGNLRELYIRADGTVKCKELDGSGHGPRTVLDRVKRRRK